MKAVMLVSSIALFGVFSAPALANDLGDGREPTKIAVSIDDVNFNNPASVQRFHARLRRAALLACGEFEATFENRLADRQCVDGAYKHAIEESERMQQAQAGTGRFIAAR